MARWKKLIAIFLLTTWLPAGLIGVGFENAMYQRVVYDDICVESWQQPYKAPRSMAMLSIVLGWVELAVFAYATDFGNRKTILGERVGWSLAYDANPDCKKIYNLRRQAQQK